MVWTTKEGVSRGQFKEEHFSIAVLQALGAGAHVEVRLLHDTGGNVTYAMTVELLHVEQPAQ